MLMRGHDGCVQSPAPSCIGTPAAECTPGQASGTSVPCGYCGTSQQRCSDQCRVLGSSCENEVVAAGRCVAGSTRRTAEGCDAGQVRSQACRPATDANRCSWAPPTGACEALTQPVIQVPAAVGGTVSRTLNAAEQGSLRAPTGSNSCPASAAQDRIGVLIEIDNPSAAPARVDLTLTPKRVSSGLGEPDRVLSIYPAPPLDDSAVRACTVRNDDCFNQPDVESCLSEVTVPASGKVWALVSHFNNAPAADFTLTVTRAP